MFNNIDICKLCPEDLVMLATTTAIELTRGKTPDEIATISAFFSQICSTLNTIKCQKLFLEKMCKSKKDDK